MPVDSAATIVRIQQHVLSVRRSDTKCASSKLYVTALLDVIDVITRQYPARQHVCGRGATAYTGDASV